MQYSLGSGLHECDVLVVNPRTGYATEVEIKVSIADLKNDFKKKHGHKSDQIKYLYYAIPDKLKDKAIPLIPLQAGIITVHEAETPYAHYYRKAKQNPSHRKMCHDEIINIGRLGCLRVWRYRRLQ